MNKAIVTCALTGVLTDPLRYPAPVTPEQMAREAKAAFDRAALAMNAGERAAADLELGRTQAALDRADRLVRQAARQMVPFARIPTEKHILYLFNDAIPSHDSARQYLAGVIAGRAALRR